MVQVGLYIEIERMQNIKYNSTYYKELIQKNIMLGYKFFINSKMMFFTKYMKGVCRYEYTHI